jgi:hypothetical protein
MSEEFTIDCKVDQPSIRTNHSASVYSLVTIRPNMAVLGALIERSSDTPLQSHLIVIVDVSGSMECLIEDDPDARIVGQSNVEGQVAHIIESSKPSRRIVATNAVRLLVERMQPDDRMTLIAFDHVEYQLADSLPRGAELSSAVTHLETVGGGGTIMGAALRKVRGAFKPTNNPGMTHRIVILSDGQDQEPERAIEEARLLGDEFHLPIYCFSTGPARGDFLLNICKCTLGGAFDNIMNEQQANDCFRGFFESQKNILATKVALNLWLSPEVFAQDLYRTKPEILYVGDLRPDESNTVVVPLEYMEKGKTYEVLFACNLKGRAAGRFRIAKASLSFDVPGLGIIGGRAEGNLVVDITDDTEKTKVLNGDVRKVIAQAEVQRQLLFMQTRIDLLTSGSGTQKDREIVAKLLTQLVQRFEESGDHANSNMYAQMKADFLRQGTITQEMLNRSLAASSKVGDGPAAVKDLDF